jgi:hypothetical protein
MDGRAPANQLRLSLPGVDRVKLDRNLVSGEATIGETRRESPAFLGLSHGTAVYGPVRTVV